MGGAADDEEEFRPVIEYQPRELYTPEAGKPPAAPPVPPPAPVAAPMPPPEPPKPPKPRKRYTRRRGWRLKRRWRWPLRRARRRAPRAPKAPLTPKQRGALSVLLGAALPILLLASLPARELADRPEVQKAWKDEVVPALVAARARIERAVATPPRPSARSGQATVAIAVPVPPPPGATPASTPSPTPRPTPSPTPSPTAPPPATPTPAPAAEAPIVVLPVAPTPTLASSTPAAPPGPRRAAQVARRLGLPLARTSPTTWRHGAADGLAQVQLEVLPDGGCQLSAIADLRFLRDDPAMRRRLGPTPESEGGPPAAFAAQLQADPGGWLRARPGLRLVEAYLARWIPESGATPEARLAWWGAQLAARAADGARPAEAGRAWNPTFNVGDRRIGQAVLDDAGFALVLYAPPEDASL